jgi:hypothetical protein
LLIFTTKKTPFSFKTYCVQNWQPLEGAEFKGNALVFPLSLHEEMTESSVTSRIRLRSATHFLRTETSVETENDIGENLSEKNIKLRNRRREQRATASKRNKEFMAEVMNTTNTSKRHNQIKRVKKLVFSTNRSADLAKLLLAVKHGSYRGSNAMSDYNQLSYVGKSDALQTSTFPKNRDDPCNGVIVGNTGICKGQFLTW